MKRFFVIFLLVINLFGKNEEFDLILKSFLYSNDIKSAYDFVKRVVEKYDPQNIYYREWLAKIALWNKKSDIALKHYYILYSKYKIRKYEDICLKLALALNRYDIAKKILLKKASKGDKKSFEKLLDILTYEAQYDQAIEYIKKFKYLFSKKEYLLKLMHFYKMNSNNKQLLITANRFAKDYNYLPTEISIKLAKYLFIKREFNKAYEILKKVDNETPYYLENLYLFSKLLNDKKTSFEALKKLAKYPNTNLYYITQLIKFYYEKNMFQKGEELALRYFHKTKNITFLNLYILNAQKNRKWNKILKILKNIKVLTQNIIIETRIKTHLI